MDILRIGKKKEDVPAPPAQPQVPSGPPTDRVINMRQQGFTNSQIVNTLQNDGFGSPQIFDAMNQADIKGSVDNIPSNVLGPAEVENPMQIQTPNQNAQQPNPNAQQYPQFQAPPGGSMEESVEEIAEAIIDEKWNELVKNINKIIEWKDKTESRIAEIEQKFKDLKNDFDALHKGVLGKVGEYDQNIINIGSEIKAMEKVFQKILPTFTEDVNTLSRLTTDLKKKK